MLNDELSRTAEFIIDTYRKLNEIDECLKYAIETDCDATKEGYTRTAKQLVKELKNWIADRTFSSL